MRASALLRFRSNRRTFRAFALAGISLFLFSGLGVGPALDCEPGGAADISLGPAIAAFSLLLGHGGPAYETPGVPGTSSHDVPEEAGGHASDECCCRPPNRTHVGFFTTESPAVGPVGSGPITEVPGLWLQSSIPIPVDPFQLPFALPPPFLLV